MFLDSLETNGASLIPHMLILGMGYTASRLAARLRGEGWEVTGVRRVLVVVSVILFLFSPPACGRGDG